ncbi:MAG: glycosyltransferase family 39 protein [Candidatus Binatia bacterium]|nr:glycosyltransferase family 39 protein [Candidatus Binatia bacterium]
MNAGELETSGGDGASSLPQTGGQQDGDREGILRRGLEVALALLLITVLWWPLSWWRLGAAPFYTKGEPREALVVWEMTHGGGWILPRRNGEEIPSKPPMFHWLGALASRAAGRVDEGTVRMPSALASLLGLYGVLLAGSVWWSVPTGVVSALVLATSFEWARAASNARVDMVLTLGLEGAFLAMLFFWQHRHWLWLLPLYAGIAWAVLAKGPVGIALPVAFGVLLLALTWDSTAWRERRWEQVCDWRALRELRYVRGLAFAVTIAGAWYVAALWEGGWAFFNKQILAENVFTFLDDPDWGGGHRHGVLYLPVQWFLGSLPWSLLWPILAISLWDRRRVLRRNHPVVGLLLWCAVVFFFYEFAASKRGVYLLAAYPAVALLCGWWWHEIANQEVDRYRLWRLAWSYAAYAVAFLLVLALCGIVVAGLAFRFVGEVGGRTTSKELLLALGVARELFSGPGLLAGGACAAFWLWAGHALKHSTWQRALIPVFVATYAVIVLGRVWVLPAYAQQVTLRPFMEAVRHATNGEAVYFWETFDYQAVYYSYRHIPALGSEAIPCGPAFLLVERGAWMSPASELRGQYEEVQLDLSGRQTLPPKLVLLRRRSF